MSDILEQLREWEHARVGTYPLLRPAIDEIEARRLEVANLQLELSAKWQVIWALRNGMDDLTQRITRLERALQGNIQDLSQPSENIAGPKINWVP